MENKKLNLGAGSPPKNPPSKQAGMDPPLPPANCSAPPHRDQTEDKSPRGDPEKIPVTTDETKPSNSKKKKPQRKPQSINNLNAMFGPQSEMWTKFFNLNFNDNETPNNIMIWTDLRNYLGNTNFTCVDKVAIHLQSKYFSQQGRGDELRQGNSTCPRD